MKNELIEGEDFYYEDGFVVFTEKYHLDKGFCCGNGCRHCPYKAPPKSSPLGRTYEENNDLKKSNEKE